MRHGLAATLVLTVSTAACGSSLVLPTHSPVVADSVAFTYLGSQGWLIESAFGSVMLGPFLSNPNAFRVMAGHLNVDEALIDEVLGHYPVSEVRAILVGHGHYDHLMDAEYIARKHATRAVVYGSETVARVLRGYESMGSRVQPVEAQTQCGDRPGEWVDVPETSIRFLAVCNEHAPQLGNYNLWPGSQETDRTEPPRFSRDYQQGQALAYLIEIRNDRGQVMRVHYADAVGDSTVGVPKELRSGGLDIMLITGPGHDRVADYPRAAIETMRPRVLFLGHWEHFMLPWSTDPPDTPTTNIDGLEEKLEQFEGLDWRKPKPGETFRFSFR